MPRSALRRYLSVWLPRLGTDLLLRQRPDWRGRPVCLFVCDQRGQSVVAVSAEAARCGLAPGMGLADARALEPGLLAEALRPEAGARALVALTTWADRFTPLAAPDPPDGLRLDITGCAHLFGGEAALRRTLLDRLARHGFEVRAAIAGTPGAAWAVARYGDDPTAEGLVPSGAEQAVLAGLPVAALRLEAPLCQGLNRVGLRRIGDLLTLPRAGLTRRFGSLVSARLDQALGVRPDPIAPQRPAPAFRIRQHFAEPIATPDSIAGAVARGTDQLCQRLEQTGKGARRFVARFFRVDDSLERPPQTVTIGTSLLGRDAAALQRLFADRLERLEPGPGFETVILEAGGVAVLSPRQPSFEAARDGPPEALASLLDRLGNRIGPDRLWQALPRASWDPERAVERVRPLQTPERESDAPERAPWPADRPRPIRLMAPPEPVEVTAPVPDDPPVLLRRRGRVHRIVRADGPERIGPEWWLGQRETRDYYRVEDGEGHRFWLYRTGSYSGATPPRWFLHGVFG